MPELQVERGSEHNRAKVKRVHHRKKPSCAVGSSVKVGSRSDNSTTGVKSGNGVSKAKQKPKTGYGYGYGYGASKVDSSDEASVSQCSSSSSSSNSCSGS